MDPTLCERAQSAPFRKKFQNGKPARQGKHALFADGANQKNFQALDGLHYHSDLGLVHERFEFFRESRLQFFGRQPYNLDIVQQGRS